MAICNNLCGTASFAGSGWYGKLRLVHNAASSYALISISQSCIALPHQLNKIFEGILVLRFVLHFVAVLTVNATLFAGAVDAREMRVTATNTSGQPSRDVLPFRASEKTLPNGLKFSTAFGAPIRTRPRNWSTALRSNC